MARAVSFFGFSSSAYPWEGIHMLSSSSTRKIANNIKRKYMIRMRTPLFRCPFGYTCLPSSTTESFLCCAKRNPMMEEHLEEHSEEEVIDEEEKDL